MAGTENPIERRPDGSIAFDVDDVTIRWRPPKMKHVKAHRNAYSDIVIGNQARVLDRVKAIGGDTTNDLDEETAINLRDQLTADMVQWTRNVHQDLRLEGDLPDDPDEWPGWLPTFNFAGATTRHWGSAPFV